MDNITNAQRHQIISQYIGTQAGRQKLAASMQQPLRLRRDYASVGRKTFLVEQLPQGALPIYDKDPEVAAFVISEEGESVQMRLDSRRVLVPLFEIATLPTIALTQVQERRFDIIDRALDKAKSQIQAAEDDKVFQILDAVATTGYDNIPGQQNPDIPVVAPIDSHALADAFARIERHDLQVARIYINATDFADFRKFGRDVLDIETQAVLRQTGLLGVMYGAQIISSRLVPAGTVYLCTTPDLFGRIPVRTELTVLSADDPANRTIGFSCFETIGASCHNPLGLARITVTR